MIQIVSAPTVLTTTDQGVIQYNVNDASSGVAAVLCGLLPSALSTCSTSASVKLGILAAGNYTYQIMATDKVGNSVTKSVVFTVNPAAPTCAADQVLSNGTCVAFACQSFVEITSFPAEIPARTADGICYYSKLFDPIANSPSAGNHDPNILSRVHGGAMSEVGNANPFILGPGPACASSPWMVRAL